MCVRAARRARLTRFFAQSLAQADTRTLQCGDAESLSHRAVRLVSEAASLWHRVRAVHRREARHGAHARDRPRHCGLLGVGVGQQERVKSLSLCVQLTEKAQSSKLFHHRLQELAQHQRQAQQQRLLVQLVEQRRVAQPDAVLQARQKRIFECDADDKTTGATTTLRMSSSSVSSVVDAPPAPPHASKRARKSTEPVAPQYRRRHRDDDGRRKTTKHVVLMFV